MSETYIDSDGSELYITRYFNGSTIYRNLAGHLHRLDGPAIEYADGEKRWYQNGRYRRLDGPAAEGINGTKEWYVLGRRHRLDGPAYEGAGGYKEWYVDGKEVEPLFLVAYWLERGRCCWFDETTQTLCFSDP